MKQRSWVFGGLSVLAALCVLLASSSPSVAAPSTDNLDALIAELQARSATLSNSTDKVEIKQKKAVDKVLKTFAKPSTSIATDIKNTGKAAKALAKTFPGEFAPATTAGLPLGSTNLNLLVQDAVTAFGDDIAVVLSTALPFVTTAPDGKCKDKAQAAIDDATTQLQALGTAPDIATKVKILTSAVKNALKGQTLAEAIAECTGGGGGNPYDWTLDVTVNGVKTSAFDNGQTGLPDTVSVVYFSDGGLTVSMTKQGGSPSLYFPTHVGNPASGTHAIEAGGLWSDGINTYQIDSGSVMITQWPSTFPDTGKADFSFLGTNVSDTNDVISGSGSFSALIYPPF